MMKAVRRKLNSSSGASILMALLLLLVAVMVSAVVLAASVSATKTIRTDREQQQTYLAVSSAAELVRDSILNGSGEYKTTETTIYSDSNYRTVYSGPTSSSEQAEGNFSSLMNTAIKAVMDQNSTAYTYACSGVTIQDTAGSYDKVTADFSLTTETSTADGAKSYVLTVTFTGGEGDHKCKMTLKMWGQEKVETKENTLYGYYYKSSGHGKDWKNAYQRTTTTSIDWTQTTPEITRERVSSD